LSGERKDKDLRGPVRRAADARGGRGTRRPFRPIRWAWLLLLAALLAPAFDLLFPAGLQPPAGRRTVVIERGESLHEIARELQRNGVIKSQVGFLVLARAMQLDRRVKAGQYSFRLGITVPALLRALDRGMYGLNLVTIPEGLMIREAARLIERQVGIRADALDSLAHEPTFIDSLDIGAPSLEGWLAPDSYEWLPGTSPEVVLRTMVARTRDRVQRATAGYDSLPLGMNPHEVLTLASIVEAESRANDERPRIARVYLNRLERGMLLQADPTVGFALGRGPRSRLTFRDLKVESPYNTYRHEGLPPGPICSPGERAILAVMNATPDIDDLYFVANGKGRHIFAPTYQQHLANIAFVKARMRQEAATAAARAAAEEQVVGGAVGDSGSVSPRPAGAPRLASSPAGSTRAGLPATPLADLKRLSPAPSAARTGTEPAKPGGASPSSEGAAPRGSSLKGDLLVPGKGVQVASSTSKATTVVKPAPPAGAADSTAKPAAKSATPKPSTTTSRTRSRAPADSTAKSPGR